MNSDRLLTLVKYLRNINPKTFFYGQWTIGWLRSCSKKVNIDLFKNTEPCGTTACAFGHACMIPEFRKLGLDFDYAGHPQFNGYYGKDAAIYFFNITNDEAGFLFYWDRKLEGFDYNSPNAEASAKEVADHIERFVIAKLAIIVSNELSDD